MYFHRLLALLLLCAGAVHAQDDPVPTVLWAFPGITWQVSPALKLSGQYGFNPQLEMHAAYLQGFIKAGKHWTFNPAYLYLGRPAGPVRQEHTLLPAVIFSLPLGRYWLLEDRNQYWVRFRMEADDRQFYRNRLRLFFNNAVRGWSFRPFFHDEAFYFFNRDRWSRNRIGAGIACTVVSRINLDVSFLLEQDRYGGRQNLVFVMGTFSLSSTKHKIERNSQQNRMLR